MNKKYILFDLDGTIVDSGEGIKKSIKYSLKDIGIIEDREDVLNDFIGPPLTDSYMKHYNLSIYEANAVIQTYREYYKDIGVFENVLYHGIEEVISSFKNKEYQIILATSKPEIFAKKVLDQHNLTKYFDFIAGATLDFSRATKIEVIQHILKNNKIDIKSAYMIGDTKFDILGGKEFGMKTIGVSYGYGNKKELEELGADNVVDTPRELLEIV